MVGYFYSKDLEGKEQIAFYEKAFNGKNAGIMKYKDSPQALPFETTKEQGEGILHTMITFWDNEKIMLSDSLQPVTIGNNIALSPVASNEEEVKQAYDVLKEGGEIQLELGETFFAKSYAKVIDKYGVAWELVYGSKD